MKTKADFKTQEDYLKYLLSLSKLKFPVSHHGLRRRMQDAGWPEDEEKIMKLVNLKPQNKPTSKHPYKNNYVI